MSANMLEAAFFSRRSTEADYETVEKILREQGVELSRFCDARFLDSNGNLNSLKAAQGELAYLGWEFDVKFSFLGKYVAVTPDEIAEIIGIFKAEGVSLARFENKIPEEVIGDAEKLGRLNAALKNMGLELEWFDNFNLAVTLTKKEARAGTVIQSVFSKWWSSSVKRMNNSRYEELVRQLFVGFLSDDTSLLLQKNNGREPLSAENVFGYSV